VSKSSRRRARAKVRKQTQRRGVPVRAAATPVPTKTQVRSKPLTKAVAVEPAGPGTADAVHAVVWRSGLLNVTAIARRELGALFVSPIGWVFAAVFTFLVSGFGFIGTVLAGPEATMEGVSNIITGLLSLILIPVLTMRLIAEERSQGTPVLARFDRGHWRPSLPEPATPYADGTRGGHDPQPSDTHASYPT